MPSAPFLVLSTVIPAQAGIHLRTSPCSAPSIRQFMLASHRNGTLYIGVTSHLVQRLHQHRSGLIEGFSSDYGVKRLVWFENGGSMEEAIRREKQIKKWKRQWKIDLIERANPDWRDLATNLGLNHWRAGASIERQKFGQGGRWIPAFAGMTK